MTTTAKTTIAYEWSMLVTGGQAKLRVTLAGEVEYLHADTGAWTSIDEVADMLSAAAKAQISQVVEYQLPRLRATAKQAEIEALAAQEFLVETNAGTYSANEATDAVGTSEPQFADYYLYERVDGTQRVKGCDRDEAPGRIRNCPGNRQELADARKKLRELSGK